MIAAIIQARMSSTRLPGKVLMNLAGDSVLSHIVRRVRASKHIEKVIIATTDQPADDVLQEYCEQKLGLSVFRGDENDVLDRFYRCALAHNASIVVRVTADDPLKDPSVIDLAIENLLQQAQLDYCSNTIEPTYPEGLDIEVFRFSALEKAWTEAKLLSEREHVTPYIWKNRNIFKVENFKFDRDLSQWRWTLDHQRDFDFISHIYSELWDGSRIFGYGEVIELLNRKPELRAINSDIIRNEGYIKSLSKDGTL